MREKHNFNDKILFQLISYFHGVRYFNLEKPYPLESFQLYQSRRIKYKMNIFTYLFECYSITSRNTIPHFQKNTMK